MRLHIVQASPIGCPRINRLNDVPDRRYYERALAPEPYIERWLMLRGNVEYRERIRFKNKFESAMVERCSFGLP